MDIREILNHCDHTLLAQTATWEEIKAILDDGIKYHVASCCIPPSFVKRAKEYVGDKLSICTVIGFPNGYNTADVKLFETVQALKEGADEIDMVVNIGDVKEHNFEKPLQYRGRREEHFLSLFHSCKQFRNFQDRFRQSCGVKLFCHNRRDQVKL